TLAEGLVRALSQEGRAETVSTDGFLYPNAVLEERDLLMRKGFPESYDRETMAAALSALRQGHADFPGYSHDIYDIDPALTRTLARPDILILEGLGFQPPSGPARASGEPDMLIYLDAALDDIEAWFLTRFMQFWEAAEHDPSSFYARFRHMSVPEAEAFALTVWRDINLPNFENHILPLRDHADLVLEKDGDHVVRIVEDRTGRKRA
ncbi:type I pantothenate kinase, partial [Henriciella aquimarina]